VIRRAPAWRMGRRRGKLIFNTFAYAALIALLVLFLFPLLWIVGLSFKTRMQVFASPPLFIWIPTLRNYAAVLGTGAFQHAFVNSLVISTEAVLLSICVGVPAAYGFARFRFAARGPLFMSLLVMRMLPPIAVLVPMYVLFSKLGLTETRISVVLAYTTFSLPLVVWIMRGFFEELPRELEESAWVDGASRFAAFRYVVLPLVRPGLVAATILCLLLAWNDFIFAAVLTNDATRTLPVLMASYSGDVGVDWGAMTASCVLVVLPVILFSFAAQRHLVAGLSSGAVKG
jgi:multiple sugar transport system permease protein